MGETILKATGVKKSFGSVVALSNINFELNAGEVMGLVGDNGAGKSTFIKVLSGVYRRDEGTVVFNGKEVDFKSPREAIDAGIETVYQDLALAQYLPIYSNMFLGREILKKGVLGALGVVDKNEMRKQAAERIARVKTKLNHVNQEVGTLSGGQRQAVAITRALSWGREVIIMDEPTAALGVKESRQVLDLIKEVRAHGIAVIFICHTIPHVMEVTDKIHVLRLGESVAHLNTADTNYEEVVQYITGAKTQE
jgi:simple sugar transport system ATP-binding protein